MGMTFMALARKHGCSDGHISKKLQKAERVVEGMLMMLDVGRFVSGEPESRFVVDNGGIINVYVRKK